MSPLVAPRTVAETATALSLSPATIRSWIASRRIGVVRLGRAVRVPSTEIARLLEAGYVPAGRQEIG
jgi:excisionase family DNA binding protein